MSGLDRRSFLAAGAGVALLPACASVLANRALPTGWRQLPTQPHRGKQHDIAFADPLIGLYGNGAGHIFRTEDGGDSWRRMWRREGTFVRALAMLSADTALLGNVGVGVYPNVTDKRPLYRTEDGGRSWTAVPIHGSKPAGICGIDVHDRETIVQGRRAPQRIVHAAGRVGGPAHYLRSSDGGRSFVGHDLRALTAAIYDVKFTGARTGFIAGSSHPDLRQARGLILRTADGGDSWTVAYRSRRPFEAVWKLSFPDERHGFASLQSYDPDPANRQRFMVASADGGREWHEVPVIEDHDWRPFGIGFRDANMGWIGGTTGGYGTVDGGRSWQPAGFGRAVNKIRFVSDKVFAIGVDVHRLEL